ncbi:DUF6059 family protein [Streptomyces sp. NPDC050560]|uniref:DUF6059 family protein n=1 Tax=Streptomyces sp. NPDC050560 TaxID=3365630 RepID=UPI003787DC6D
MRRWTRVVANGLAPGVAALAGVFGALLPLDWMGAGAGCTSAGCTGRGCTGARCAGPAPGHPERLVPEVPPTPVEEALWRQLAGHS